MTPTKTMQHLINAAQYTGYAAVHGKRQVAAARALEAQGVVTFINRTDYVTVRTRDGYKQEIAFNGRIKLI